MVNFKHKKMHISSTVLQQDLKWSHQVISDVAILPLPPTNAASSLLPRILRDKAAIAIMLAALAGHPAATQASVNHKPLPVPQHWTPHSATVSAYIASPPTAAGVIAVPVSHQVRSVVVVDWTVADYQTLIAGMDPTIPVIILKPGESGLEGLAQALSGYHDLDVIHLVTEGQGGAMQLGLQWVDDAAIQADNGDVKAIGAALKPGGGVRLYGCSVAQGDAGKRFVNDLAHLLGNVAVAASINPTGPTLLGGDWDLEYSTGTIETVLPFALAGMQGINHRLGCTVTGAHLSGDEKVIGADGHTLYAYSYIYNSNYTYWLVGNSSIHIKDNYGNYNTWPVGTGWGRGGDTTGATIITDIQECMASSATAPTVVTNAANAITASGATLNGTESSNGASTAATFDYGLTTSYGSSATASQSPLASDASGAAISAAINSLTCNTTYHFRAIGVNSAGTTYGSDLSFLTSACPNAAPALGGSFTTSGTRPSSPSAG